ncbi:hypothetical protein BDV26DRAFT_260084 [Aspergillus bertholletiae]|uniref:Transmembrane protein n=1 Tax=Aspergillus bertholletiae TaxID=1226010 RepID=A0A5N7BBG3_9EURO|nr:hypothetical protein BDV26DRAFT_260084 [Aspergillus bertholletiae]
MRISPRHWTKLALRLSPPLRKKVHYTSRPLFSNLKLHLPRSHPTLVSLLFFFQFPLWYWFFVVGVLRRDMCLPLFILLCSALGSLFPTPSLSVARG